MTKRLTTEEIAEIEKRCAAATRGPWSSNDHSGWAMPYVSVDNGDRNVIKIGDTTLTVGHFQSELANAEFIAHARADLPRALETIRQLEAERDQQKKLIDETADGAIGIIETCRKEFPKVGLELSPNDLTVLECFDALMQECLELRAELAQRQAVIDALAKALNDMVEWANSEVEPTAANAIRAAAEALGQSRALTAPAGDTAKGGE